MTHRVTTTLKFLSFIFTVLAIAGLAVPAQAQQFQSIGPLFFTKPFGGANPLPQVIQITSTTTAFSYTVAAATNSGGAWLSTSPSGFCCTTPDSVRAIVNPAANLAAGTYTGQLTFTASGVTTMVVPVTLIVAAAGGTYLDYMPGGLSFTAKPAAASFATQTFQVRNGGTGTLGWTLTASTSNAGNWLTVSATSGTAPTFVTVGINPANLPNGGQLTAAYSAILTFQGAGTTMTVPISVTLADPAFQQQSGLHFTRVFGSEDPPPQMLTLSSTGTATSFTATAMSANGGNFVVVSPSGFCCNTPATVAVSVATDVSLAAGNYVGQVLFDNGKNAIVVPVTLTVLPVGTPFLENIAGQLSYSLKTGGGGNPPAKTVQVRNGGPGASNWTVTATTSNNGNWLTVTPNTGAAPTFVSVGVIPANLPNGGLLAGVYSGQLRFDSSGSIMTVPA
jgi:hypothetical protein